MTICRDLSILWSLFHVLILFMMLYRSRYTRRKTLLLTGALMGPLILVNMAGMFLFGAELIGKVFVFTCTLPSLLFFWFISKDKKGRYFFTFCLADTVAYWIIAVTNVLDFYIGGERYILMFAGRLLLFPLTEWIAVRHLRKPYLELQESVTDGWGIFAGMTALYYILLAVFANYPVVITKRPQEMPAFVLILALMPMTYATMFIAMYRQLLLYRKQQSERLMQEQNNTLEARLESQQRVLKMKHDMKGYAVTLSGLLSAGNTEEALEYLKGVQAEMDAVFGQFSVNPYVNAVFVRYYQKFQEMGADCSFDIQIGAEKLPNMEICRILTNGLENACDALKEIGQSARTISVQMKYNRDYLLIRMKNRCRAGLSVEKGTIPATGKGGCEHGFGLPSIKEAAERLDGGMLCYTEKEIFILDVMVRVKE